jgi:hypothetical protein
MFKKYSDENTYIAVNIWDSLSYGTVSLWGCIVKKAGNLSANRKLYNAENS